MVIGWRVKDLNKEEEKEYYRKLYQERIEYHRKYCQEHKEEKREYSRKYRQEHKEEEKEYKRKWYQDNKEERKEHKRKWYQDNKEYYRKWYQEHKEEKKEYNRKYYQDNPEITLLSNKRAIEKLAKKCKVTLEVYMYALLAWSKTVKKRDKVCQVCYSKDTLHSHHIFEKAKYPQLTFNENNGIVLCEKCHYQVHGKKLNNKVKLPVYNWSKRLE
jgi:5-methylcytosine-specific restriction endonuclease McrA